MLIVLEHPVHTFFLMNVFLNIYYNTRQSMCCTYDVTLGRVRASIVVVEEQWISHNPTV